MLNSRTRWIVRQSDQAKSQELEEQLKITPLVAKLLVNRGLDTVDSARYFLFAEETFHDPFLLKGMDNAVARINLAISSGEPILIYGDYDADGVSSTTVLMVTLRELGANVQFYIPDRFSEGYGPNEQAFKSAAEKGIKLIITVDTGISALHEASIAKDLGMDLIITDHHEPGPVLPEALAIIHPKLEDSVYPFRELAGVGVAFKLAHALYGHVPEHLLEIAVIGTIADLVSLKGENRLIAKKGIEKLKQTNNIGIKAIFRNSGTDHSSINEETIGFTLAPRINAVGRLEHASFAVELLLTKDPSEAAQMAEKMESLNKERQSIVNTITTEAIEQVEKEFPPDENKVLVVGKEGWNAGVIGIVASRLVERFYRPVIVLSFDREKGLAKGSARSIAGFDLFKNLSECKDILPHFGGHPMAAGMTLKLEDVGELRMKLNSLAGMQMTEDDFIPLTYLDAEVQISDIDLHMLEEMGKLSPYGMDNPKPKVLVSAASILQMKKIGSEQNHLKLMVSHQESKLDGIGFGLGNLADHISPSSELSLIGELSINEWNNIRKPQIFINDLAVSSWQLFDYRAIRKVNSIADKIPVEPRTFIVFNEQYLEAIQLAPGDEIFLIRSKEDGEKVDITGKNIVICDMPSSKEQIEVFLDGKTPARIYTVFYKDGSDFFSTVPGRDHFKWFYAFLMKNSPFDIGRHGGDLAKRRGWSRETIEFMSQVFFELDFVTINNGLIMLKKEANKRDLSESELYQSKHAQSTLEKDLIYSSYQQLKSWFDQIFQERSENREATKQWT